MVRYCLGCGYIIDNLPEPRCPECSRPFDLSDPSTFTYEQQGAKKTRRILLVAAMYLMPLALGTAFWLRFELNWWRGRKMPLLTVIRVLMLQGCGPLIFPIGELDTHWVAVCFVGLWVGWLTLVCKTRLKKFPLLVHLAFGAAWSLSGSFLLGLSV